MNLTQIGLAVFASFFLLTLLLMLIAQDRLARHKRRLRDRLRRITETQQERDEGGELLLRDERISGIPFLQAILSRMRFARNLQTTIDEAGLPFKAGTLILAMLSLTAFVWLLCRTFVMNGFLAIIPAIIIGVIPYLWVLRKRTARIDRYEELLPEAIDLIVNALRSGFSLEASLQLVAQEIPDPLGTEYAIVFEEQNLGLDLGQALHNLTKRMPSQDQIIMNTAITIQKRSGGNLTEVLSKISDLIRDRFMLRREIRTLTAQGRMSGYVLGVLPIVLLAVLSFMSPAYIRVLFTDPAGKVLLMIAVFLQIIGFLFIRRIIRLNF